LALIYAATALPAAVRGDMSGVALAASLLLGAGLVALSAIDLETYRLPDWLTLPLCAAGVVIAWLAGWDSLLWRVVSAATGFAGIFGVAQAYEAARGRSGLGLGDAKLMALSGAWVGVAGLISVLALACAAALCAVLIAWLRGRAVGLATAIPFGPFLAAGTWLTWLYGPLT
jgi:leader peptidase (prepilin peptidase)/N-methyltransferase